ncbi:MAG: hypothetical protein AAFV80_06440 [Bacteroidota bacterium]
MKLKWIICLFLFLGTAVNSFAQSGERIKAAKVAFITDHLQLTVEESQAFWPLYNEMESKIQEIKKSAKAPGKIELMNDAELEEHLLKSLNARKQEAELYIEYYDQLKSVLPIRKLAMLQNAEKEFRKILVEKLQEQRRERMQNRMNKQSPKG